MKVRKSCWKQYLAGTNLEHIRFLLYLVSWATFYRKWLVLPRNKTHPHLNVIYEYVDVAIATR